MSEVAQAKTEKKSGGALPLLVGVNSLIVLGLGALLVLKGGLLGHPAAGAPAPAAEAGEAHGGGEASAPAGPGPTVHLGDLVVRLRNADADRYLRASFDFEVPSDKDKDALTARLPQLRDLFITYLSDRTVEELRGSQGLDTVKKALLDRSQQLAPGAHLRALYLTEAVVQ